MCWVGTFSMALSATSGQAPRGAPKIRLIEHKEKINNASFNERKEFWKDTPEAERMDKWRNDMNALLDEYKNDPTKKAAQTFLKKILKRADQKTLDEVEVTADTVYSTFIEDTGGDVEYYVRQIIEKTDFNIDEIEQNLTLIIKLGGIYGTNSGKIALQLIQSILNANKNPALNDYATLYSIIGTDIKENIDVAISQKARLQTLHLVGVSGSGKSTLLDNLIRTDLKHGLPLCVIDPHGDLVTTVLASIPDYRLKDVIYFDVEDVDYPSSLGNIFECPEPRNLRNMAATASFVSHVFEKVWGAGTDTPRLMQNLRAVTRTLIENPGATATFSEIPLLFSNETVRAKMVANLTNTAIISFWEDYERKSQRDRNIYIESFMNKVNAFVDEPMIRNIVSQSETTINLRKIMDESKILLIKLSPQFEEASTLIGAILIGKLLMAAFSRADTPEENRRQFNLYVDEFQRFATSDFATLISEARKFRIATTLSHQTLAQLDEANRTAAAAAANMIVFRVSGDDAKALARSFDTTPTKKEIIGEEPIRVPVADVISHLVTRGHNDARVARFAQIYLKNLVNFVSRPPHVGLYGPPSNMPSDYRWQGVVVFEYSDIYKARELLNESLYRCMVEKTTHFIIPPLALYMLAVAQQDRSDQVFDPYIKAGWWEDNYLRGFKDGVEVFGDPYFINKDFAPKFIDSRWKREKPAAIAVVNMITELRYTMAILAEHPILVDTGQYQPKYQNRTYADMENEISRDLTQQPNFQARVKLLAGEHTIQTKNSPPGLTGSQLAERIAQIQTQTRKNYCKPRLEVEREIRERQEKWRSGASTTSRSGLRLPSEKPPPLENPPPTSY
jgi:hypothetical protein